MDEELSWIWKLESLGTLGRVPAAKGEVRVCETIIGRFGARHCSSGSKLDSLRIPPALHPNADSSFS